MFLIQLLSPNSSSKPGFAFSNSAKIWSLVLKTILKVKVPILIFFFIIIKIEN